jgi:hypothetical protein
MDDLDLLRKHLPETAVPTEDAKRHASARLAQAMAGEARRATARSGNQTPVTRLLRLIRARPRSSALALATLTAATAAAALFLSAPWKGSPDFLARAEAALTQPGILHMKLQTASTWTRPSCTVTYSQAEVWVDETPPNTYRILLSDLPPDPVNTDPRARGCFTGKTSELGGSYDSQESQGTLRFTAPNRLSHSELRFRFLLNPAAALREAIRAGRAHDEGKTELDGRTVERVRIDPPPPPCAYCPSAHPERIYAYVDPETFYPVEIVATHYQVEIVGGPGTSTHSRVGVRDVTHYLTFEYLPRTDANLALTNIRAQHPNATGP